MEEHVPQQVVDRRLRNHIIEYLKMASSRDELLEYQRNAPVNVLNELINQWEDWVYLDLFPKRDVAEEYPSPTYTDEERMAIVAYHKVWKEVADRIPAKIKTLEQFLETPLWPILAEAASKSLAIFQKRGKLAEEYNTNEERE
jgi:hypothetical protein